MRDPRIIATSTLSSQEVGALVNVKVSAAQRAR